ncbi:MAG: gamma-glutamyltransferase [Caldilineales bacterium]|nr:gamma-glutamyltransferase [Caldilineales bacterium]
MTKHSGIIAAGHHETAMAGAEILRSGGGAIDAAIAAAFASFVAEPTLVSPGGGGYALCFRGDNGGARLYDFFCNFPGLSSVPPSKIDFFPVSVDYGPANQVFHIGRGSLATPGVIAGLCRMQAEGGRLPLSVVLEPAISLARSGVRLGEFGSAVGHLLEPIFRHDENLARLFGAPDRFMAPDWVYRNPDLASTFELLGREGPNLFYREEIAHLIVADQEAHGGLLNLEDLAAYNVIVREPLHMRYRQFELLTNPPPSRGGALIAFALGLLESYDIASLRFGNARHLALLTEVMRQTNLARPLFEATRDAEILLDPKLIAQHSRDLGWRLAHEGRGQTMIEPAHPEHNNTTHLSVLDDEGNFVSLTTTAGESPGYVLSGTGLVLNNILGEADLHPDGFHQGQPGARIGSMMAPTIVLCKGEPVLALGSGGANRIRTAILQVITNFLDFDIDLPTAVAAPRIHFEQGVLQVEGRETQDALAELQRWGYELNFWEGLHMFFGGVHAVGKDASGNYQGAGDARRNGAVIRV